MIQTTVVVAESYLLSKVYSTDHKVIRLKMVKLQLENVATFLLNLFMAPRVVQSPYF